MGSGRSGLGEEFRLVIGLGKEQESKHKGLCLRGVVCKGWALTEDKNLERSETWKSIEKGQTGQ